MKHPTKKRIACILTALLLLLALACGFAAYGLVTDTRDAEAQVRKKLESISMSLNHVLQYDIVINDNYEKILLKKARLSALPLREVVQQGGDGEIRAYENGFVLRLDGGRVILPEGLDFPALAARDFMDGGGAPLDFGRIDLFYEESGDFQYLCAFQRITGDYYYLDYTLPEVRQEYMMANLDIDGLCENLEQAFDGSLLLYGTTDEGSELLYASQPFENIQSIEETGIDLGIDPRTISDMRFGGVKYFYTLSEPILTMGDAQNVLIRAAFVIPFDSLSLRQLPRLLIALGIAAAFFIAAIAWVLNVCAMVRRSVLTAEQRSKYGVDRVRKITAAIGIAGVVAVMLSAILIDALLMLYDAIQDNHALLRTMNAVVSQYEDNTANIDAQVEDAYVRYARRAARLLAANPQLRNEETLQEICDVIGVDYLMLYDDTGRETLSNASFVGLAFSRDEDNSTYDFRRLLKGVPSIVHDVCVDETTGLERQLIGVSMDDGDVSDGYGALIMARNPGSDDTGVTLDEMIQAMTPEDSLCLILNPEDGAILHASNPDYVDKNALTLGLPDYALQDNFMDYFRFNGARWYSCSGLYGDSLYHCAARVGAIYSDLAVNALVFGALFIVAYALFALVLLRDYTDAAIDEYGQKMINDVKAQKPVASNPGDNTYDRLGQAIREMRLLHRYRSPEKKTWMTFQMTAGCMLLLVAAFLMIAMNRPVNGLHDANILSYVMGNGWKRGVNLFAITRIMIMVVSVVALVMVVDLLSELLCLMLEKRGETVCHLIRSFIEYGCVLAVLFASFELLGFDTRALLASVGLLSLAVSLGAKDLVADVFSGISIAFSDEYQIGDFVEIDHFRGWVMEIGVRFTTLVNTDGNIKNMSNRDVKNVLNLSRRNCRYTIDITIAYSQSLQQVEEILNRELPKIGEAVDEILSGPSYQGVTAIGNGGITLTIMAECKEHHYGRVRSRLNREIRLMMEKNDIAIK